MIEPQSVLTCRSPVEFSTEEKKPKNTKRNHDACDAYDQHIAHIMPCDASASFDRADNRMVGFLLGHANSGATRLAFIKNW